MLEAAAEEVKTVINRNNKARENNATDGNKRPADYFKAAQTKRLRTHQSADDD